MLFQVGINARAKRFLSQIRLQHPQDCGGLAVRDAVKQFLNLRRSFRRLMNWAGVGECIHVERSARAADVVEAEVPFGFPLLQRLT